jgi:sulfur-oxidizing protein SoxY
VPIDEIELRLRIDRETSVRAIAELADGSLEMRSTWVRASGGCSAPPSASGPGTLGDIRFRPSPDAKSLQMSIKHPNNSGFQIDPVSGDPIPPHFVSHIRVRAGEALLLDADTGISLSENPTIRIASGAPFAAPIAVEATDSKQAHFDATWTGHTTKAGGR